MKKWIPLVLALSLLAGCAGPKEATQTPAPTPEAASSPLPTTSQVLAPVNWEMAEPWWLGVDMDQLPARYADGEYVDGDTRYTVFQSSEELGLLLYAVTRDGQEGVQFLLRKDDTLGEAFRREAPISKDGCVLSAGDYDGDGDAEYAISVTYSGNSNDLILCEWDEGGWTFHPYFSEAFNPQIAELLSFHSTGDTVILVCGALSASYPLKSGERSVSAMEDFSGIAILTPHGDSITAAFGVGAVINGTPKIFATLRAELAYDGENFTLQNPQLEEIVGV